MSKLSRISDGLKKNWRRGGDKEELPVMQMKSSAIAFPEDTSSWPQETVTRRWYSWNKKQWMSGRATVRIAPEKFAEGNMRLAYFMVDVLPDGKMKKCVAKRQRQYQQNSATYEMDIMTQACCQGIARAYNLRKPEKPVYFLDAYLIQQPDGTWWHVETYLQGKFVKHNNNWGVIGGARNTPQAFSHFSYEFSNQRLIVVDIQGVDDFYTDPQIHTVDKQGFGFGNMGQAGIDRFLRTHHCSELCTNLGLTFIAPKLLGIIPRTQRRQDGTIQVAEQITLTDDQMKVREFLGKMQPKPDSASREELTLLRMNVAQFNRLVSEFKKQDKDKTGFLELEDIYNIFHRLNEPGVRTKSEDFPGFAQRVQTQLDQEGMVDFMGFLLCWTDNLQAVR